MKLKKWEIALIIALIITVACGFALDKEQRELSDKMIRLHVIANSDGADDQDLKLEVRDRVLDKLEPLLESGSGKASAEEIIGDNLELLEDEAMKVISGRGLDYSVKASLTEEFYPTREYESFSLPAGEYTSLRIIIGEGEGANWWCVVFPPLCTTVETVKSGDFDELSDEEVSLITEDGTGYVIKFKALEILAEIKNLFS